MAPCSTGLFMCVSFSTLQASPPSSFGINSNSVILKYKYVLMNAEQQVQYLCPIFAYCKFCSANWCNIKCIYCITSSENPVKSLYVCTCECPDLYMNRNLGALVFQGCCHTRQKWNLWVCGFVLVCCVCISKHVPIRVFSYPQLCRRHLWRLPLFLFSNSLSFSPFVVGMFSSMWLGICTFL